MSKPLDHEQIRSRSADFNRFWYEDLQRSSWRTMTFLGVPMQQCPTDLWTYQELIFRLKPDTVVEIGVKKGGTTLWLATLLELVGHGEVIGVDINLIAEQVVRCHERVFLLEGDSTSEEVIQCVKSRAGRNTMVLLDSNHSRDHVFAELTAYSPLVPDGGYVIVNDTNINGHPSLPEWGPGPWEAVEEFLRVNRHFVPDFECERHGLTLSPLGFLRREMQTRANGN